MKKFIALLLLLLPVTVAIAQANGQMQNAAVTQQTIKHFLQSQTAGLPGKVEIVIGPIDPRLALTACAALEPFIPRGGKLWGKTTVGAKCTAPESWTIYVQANIVVMADYIATTKPLSQGQIITADDLTVLQGDLTLLPPGIITAAAQAVGKSSAVSIPVGTPLRQDSVRNLPAVQQGKIVRLISEGTGFQISSEGKALNTASEGQPAQARTQSGQVVNGIARTGGIIEVTY
ncbi:MAG: flagellar basal body P-ring formation protein FlgA [Glaciimonas sp.]|nr:flagellar basal body P-ring formation protein FlgA [Glaciimonas sp.]